MNLLAYIRSKMHTLFLTPLGVYRKYKEDMSRKISGLPRSIATEDYHLHWNYLSFKNKTVLDLGADFGSTALYFKKKGAREIIAVEGDPELAILLKQNARRYPYIVPMHKRITSSKDIEHLIDQYKFDVAKVDIEGAEAHLDNCNNLSKIPQWMVEVHNPYVYRLLTKKFQGLGYRVRLVKMNGVLVMEKTE